MQSNAYQASQYPSGPMQQLPAAEAAPPTDWFSQSGFATALSAAAVSAVSGNPQMMTTAFNQAFDTDKQKSWFESKIGHFREYFNVTHAYVRWKLIFVLLPFVPSADRLVSRSASRDVPQSADVGEQTGQGGGVGLRLFPGRKPDLYIPIMGFITFVLVHALSRWRDFHPDDLYNIASLGILLGLLEVMVIKGASYAFNIANWTLTDIVAICGYKFINLAVCAIFLMIFSSGGRAVWMGFYALAAATAGLAAHKGLLAVGSYNANEQHYMGTGSGAMERLLSMAAGGAQFLWIWILMPAMTVQSVITAAHTGGIRQGTIPEAT